MIEQGHLLVRRQLFWEVGPRRRTRSRRLRSSILNLLDLVLEQLHLLVQRQLFWNHKLIWVGTRNIYSWEGSGSGSERYFWVGYGLGDRDEGLGVSAISKARLAQRSNDQRGRVEGLRGEVFEQLHLLLQRQLFRELGFGFRGSGFRL